SSTGTADGARIGLVKVILVSGASEDMALIWGREARCERGCEMSVSRTRRSVLHGAPQIRDQFFLVCLRGPRISSAPLTRCAASGERLPHRVETPGQNPLLRMQAVLGLVEHHRLR